VSETPKQKPMARVTKLRQHVSMLQALNKRNDMLLLPVFV